MSETEETITFTTEELDLCKSAITVWKGMHRIAIELKSRLMERNVISFHDTYTTVKNRKPLMEVLQKSIALGLDHNIESGRFGLGIVSDFDLYFNMSSNPEFNEYLDRVR